MTGWNTLVFQGSRGDDGATTVTFSLNNQSGTDLDASFRGYGFDFPEAVGTDLIFGNNAAGDYPFSGSFMRCASGTRRVNRSVDSRRCLGSRTTYEALVGTEVGLAAFPLDELQGVPVEQSRGRTVLNSAHWPFRRPI